MPRNFLALPSFGFSIAHFPFSLRFDALDMRFDASEITCRISGHEGSGLEVVCFLVSLHPDYVYPSGGFSFNLVNL